ncbi:hypothetical protein BHAOGJBA_1452 [Methylobacterium hispanicum]|uniref:Integrase n=1 Tax=Methylobacterium hispanicum TaxID=270350 RepID=A0AAV4ZJG7_9HYPH|nr:MULTISPECIES: site-specific integrase [Methylobacterium]GJD87945.1 hypothetical protein BHAOGJBA_1452 [Methylobacterium hispanicum]
MVRFGSWIEGDARHAPLPLLRFFDRTRAGSSPENFNSFIANAHKFWDFCRAQAPRLNLARASFDNPVVPQMDRLVKHSHQKTNKNPIPASVLPYLLRYAYACEGFFMDLSARSLAGALTDEERKYVNHTIWTFGTFDPARFGLKVGFEFEDKRHEIGSIPLLAPWWDRFVKCEQGDTTAFLPALSGLRMVIGALETGIRFQGIQWLDRKTYRSLADDGAPGSELVPLVVNTDKVRDRPWKTLIVRRAYDLLRREEAYQDLLADAFVDRPVFYERREHSRFAPVLPLFRGPQSSQPVADGAYTTAWERLIVGFSLWYERHVPGAEPLRMWRYVPDTEPGTRKPRVTMHVEGEEQRPCCLLKVKLRHTPHSARSTFISARSGILPIEVTGWLVGHTNRATTYHYTVEEERKLKAKLIAASNALWAPDRDNPVHIRADAVNSALRKSFESNPGQTVAAFGLQSISLLNVDASDTDGISVLRSTAMSYVTFRETHICPVGEACPSNVMDVIVEPRRCGLCPLAIRSVDHLPSIAAKMRRLLEQVREGAQVVERYRRRGEPAASVAEVNQRRRLDVMEYEGWKTALVLLTKTLAELGRGSADAFHVGMPDAVRLHLRLVTRDADAAEFILQRIVDSHGHAAFETPLVRAQAAQLRQRLLASTGVVEAEMDRVQDDPVAALVSSLRLVLQARGIAPTFRAALETVRARCALGPGEAMPSLPEPGSA